MADTAIRITGTGGCYTVSIDGEDSAIVTRSENGGLTCSCGEAACIHQQQVRACGFVSTTAELTTQATGDRPLAAALEPVICGVVASALSAIYDDDADADCLPVAIARHQSSSLTEFVTTTQLEQSEDDWDNAIFLPRIAPSELAAATYAEAERLAFSRARSIVADWRAAHQHEISWFLPVEGDDRRD